MLRAIWGLEESDSSEAQSQDGGLVFEGPFNLSSVSYLTVLLMSFCKLLRNLKVFTNHMYESCYCVIREGSANLPGDWQMHDSR